MPVCNCPPACTKSRFNDISLLVLCSSVVGEVQYCSSVLVLCSSVVGVVVHILLLGGGEVLLVLCSSVVDCSVLHCSCSVVDFSVVGEVVVLMHCTAHARWWGRIIHCLTTGFSLAAGCGHDTSRK